MRRAKPKPKNKPVIGGGPVTGEHYVKIQEKLGLDVGPFLGLLGANMKDHFVIHQNLAAPIADEGMALHLRLLDRYPELVQPEPTVDELVQEIKAIARESPDLKLPMRITPSLVGLLLGRHTRTSSLWSTRRTGPAWKVAQLMRDLLTLLETHPDAAAFLEEYVEMVKTEAAARGESDLFTAKKWPKGSDSEQKEAQD